MGSGDICCVFYFPAVKFILRRFSDISFVGDRRYPRDHMVFAKKGPMWTLSLSVSASLIAALGTIPHYM